MAELNTIARPYTKAAFEFALNKGGLDQWSEMLSFTAVVVNDSEMKRVLGTPSLSAEQKAQLIISVCDKKLDDAGKNFIYLLAENQRLALLPKISVQFDQLKAEHEKSVDVDMTTAYELDPQLVDTLAQALRSKLGREVKITSQVDQSILGGIILRANDLVIDGSVRAKLAKLAEAMNS
ncbi:F0F1 ATP synthase subunit delta [Nitrincola tapanii]|uniref:ATP synthase subunit delta n=1 Tax=Nitrincola tapanii TaxID=1708751 RepID=A0A5A9W2L8_9GAMM|nr:F0F1 ATP synthase subunit delta [Nitrincola tapanii]KAA0873801.1 F0F1 ATP synthase subunit delta [Nitrincola tapanii]